MVHSLDDLAAVGVDSCRSEDMTLMRQAAFATAPIKEIALLGADGKPLCTDPDLPLGERKLLSSEPLGGAAGYTLDIILLGNGERTVRLRRPTGTGPNDIAALIPAALFLPLVSTNGGPFSAYASMATPGGATIGAAGEERAADAFVSRLASEKYGFKVAIFTAARKNTGRSRRLCSGSACSRPAPSRCC